MGTVAAAAAEAVVVAVVAASKLHGGKNRSNRNETIICESQSSPLDSVRGSICLPARFSSCCGSGDRREGGSLLPCPVEQNAGGIRSTEIQTEKGTAGAGAGAINLSAGLVFRRLAF